MREPIASKLAELRKAIQQIEATPRRSFTKKQRQAVFDAYDGRCAGCDEHLKPGWQVDHIKEIADGGAHEPSNWQPLCSQEQNGCHVGKTAAFLTRKAKATRIRKRETEGPKPAKLKSNGAWPKSSRPIQSRGFDKPRKVEVV